MTIYAAGSEQDIIVGGRTTTSANTFDDDFSRGAILAVGAANVAAVQMPQNTSVKSGDGLWVHTFLWHGFYTAVGGTQVPGYYVDVTNQAGDQVFGFKVGSAVAPDNLTALVVRNKAGTTVSALTPIFMNPDDSIELDIHYYQANTSTIYCDLYSNEAFMQRVSVQGSVVDFFKYVRFYGSFYGGTTDQHKTRFSEIIVANEPTLGMRVLTVPISGNGDLQQWAGSAADVADSVSIQTANGIGTSNTSAISLFKLAALSSVANTYDIYALGVNFRGKTSVGDIAAAVKVNGSVYFSTSLKTSVNDSGYGNYWTVNPNTGSNWTVSQLASVQVGVKKLA